MTKLMRQRNVCVIEWSAMAPAGDMGLMTGATELQSTEPKYDQEKEPGRSAPLTITPLGNNYYGSRTSLNEDQKIPGSPETPIGNWLCIFCYGCKL